MRLFAFIFGLLLASPFAYAFFIQSDDSQLRLGDSFNFCFREAEGKVRYWIEKEGIMIMSPRRTSNMLKEFEPKSVGNYLLFAQDSLQNASFSFSVLPQASELLYEAPQISSRAIAKELLVGTCVLITIGLIWLKG